MNLVNRIRETRLNKNVSQKELANVLNTTQQAISLYESGKREPKIEIWEKLANFFSVSVSFLQGFTYTTDEIIKIVHEYYFEKNEIEQIGTFNYEFVKNINLYIRLTSYDPVPRALYAKETKDFPLTKKVKKYWLDHFKDILDSQRLQDINKGNKDDVTVSFDSEVEKYIAKFQSPYKLTLLGKLYQDKFKNENELHDKTIQKIKYLDLSSAKEAINEYAKLVNELRDEVNGFKKDSFNQNDYDKDLIQDIKNQVYMMNLSSDELVEKIVNELISRIKAGDIDCRNYMAEHSNSDFIEVYGNYKKERGEDTTDTDEYIRERDEIIGNK